MITLFSLFFLLVELYVPSVKAEVYKFGRATRINDVWVSGENLWLATDNGLYELTKDGYVVRVVDSTYGLPDIYIKRVILDSSRRLYALSNCGLSIIYLADRVSQNYTVYEGFPRGNAEALDVSDRYVVASSSEYLWILNKEDGEQKTVKLDFYINDVVIVEDNVYIATYGGFYWFNIKKDVLKQIVDGKVNDLYRYGSYVYVATKRGLYRYHLVYRTISKVLDIGYDGDIEKIAVSSKGDIVAVSGNKLYIKPIGKSSYKLSIGNTNEIISVVVPYKTDVIVAINGASNAQLFWVSHLFYVNKLWDTGSDAKNNVVSFIMPENNMIVWFKYGESIYWFNQPGSIYPFNFVSKEGKAIDGSIILSIVPWVTGDRLALGTLLGFYVANKISRVMETIDISAYISESIVDVDEDQRGNYFILTRKYLYVYNAYSGFFTKINLPKGNYGYDVEFFDGNIYVATNKSILRYSNYSLVGYKSIAFGAKRIKGTLGGLWVITNGKLLFLDRKLQKTVSLDIFDNVVSVDSWGKYLVVGTEHGVFLYRKGRIWGVYTAVDGKLTSDIVTDIKVWNNFLVVGTHAGLNVVRLDPSFIPFRDVVDVSTIMWLKQLRALGIVKGDGYGQYMPEKIITVQELVVLLARVFHTPLMSCDVKNADSWALQYICGYFDGNVPQGVIWTDVLTPEVLNKYFPFVAIDSSEGVYRRISVFKFLYDLIYSSGLWR